jgi:hypothetical protein
VSNNSSKTVAVRITSQGQQRRMKPLTIQKMIQASHVGGLRLLVSSSTQWGGWLTQQRNDRQPGKLRESLSSRDSAT